MGLWSRLFGEIEEETQYRPESGREKFRIHDIDSFQEEDLLKRQRGGIETRSGGIMGMLEETDVNILNTGEKAQEIVAYDHTGKMQEVNAELAKKFGGIFGVIFFIILIMFFPPLAIPLILFWIIKSANKKKGSSWKRSWNM